MKIKPIDPSRTEYENMTEIKRSYIKRKAEESEADKRLDEYYKRPHEGEDEYAPPV